MSKILIVSSTVHQELSAQQLELCEALVKKTGLEYEVELLAAGTYEIPFVIQSYHQKKHYDAYIALGLILKTDLDHYAHITSHIRYCFTQFALSGIIVGNGIVAATSREELEEKILSPNPCLSAYPSAVNAVESLIKLQQRLA